MKSKPHLTAAYHTNIYKGSGSINQWHRSKHAKPGVCVTTRPQVAQAAAELTTQAHYVEPDGARFNARMAAFIKR